MTKVVIFNGPPRSGKDTVATLLQVRHPDLFIDMKMAYCLKKGVHELLGIQGASSERYNDVKDVEDEDFFGKTPRETYIACAERFLKIEFSQELFGYTWLRRYRHEKIAEQGLIATISDCGFHQELAPLFRAFGPQNMIMIRIHREGFDYSSDSRNYVYVANRAFHQYDLKNENGNFDGFYHQVVHTLEMEGVFR